MYMAETVNLEWNDLYIFIYYLYNILMTVNTHFMLVKCSIQALP